MNITKKVPLLATGALLCALVTHASLASATVLCRTNFPGTISQCQYVAAVAQDNDRASGFGQNLGGTSRKVSVTFAQGTSAAQAAILDSNGNPIPGCTTPLTRTTASITCNTSAQFLSLFVTAN